MLTSRQHTVLATVLIIVVAYFTKLGSVEVQPWDEGLYAVRGEGIVLYGNVWDQTEHALGGLYSSIPAPMVSWHVAIGTYVFGRTAVGVRLITILDAGIALCLLYVILLRLVSHRTALLSVIIMGASLHWVVYSRQAMTEVPLMTYTLLALWGCFRLRELLANGHRWQSSKVLLFVAVFGIGLGFAMLTKLVVGALPILFVIGFLFNRDSRMVGALGVSVGLIIALPWYVYMAVAHGAPFFAALTLQHATSVVEGNTRHLGFYYYLNQLIVAQPALVLAFLVNIKHVPSLLKTMLHRFNSENVERWQEAIIFTWFALVFIGLSASPTKNPHYVVMLIPPSMCVAAVTLERMQYKSSPRLMLMMFAVLVIACMWSWFGHIRTAVKQDPLDVLIVGMICFIAVLLPLVIPEKISRAVAARARFAVALLLISGSVVTAVHILWYGFPGQIRGGREIAVRLLDSGEQTFTYLYHEHNAADSLNPQLAWYTAGWMTGANENRSYQSRALPEFTSSLNAIAEVAVSGIPYVVYYHPSISSLVQREVLSSLAAAYNVEWKNDHYTLLRRTLRLNY